MAERNGGVAKSMRRDLRNWTGREVKGGTLANKGGTMKMGVP